MPPNARILQRSTVVSNQRQLARTVRAAIGHDHLVSIGIHHKIGVVRDDDDLAPLLRNPESLHKFLEDRLRVQILFRLIDDQRSDIFRVNGQIQQ